MSKKSNKNKSESSLKVVKKTLKYFYPIAWRYNKSYFIIYSIKLLIEIIRPFINIIFMPLIIDELLGSRNTTRIIIYAALLVIGGAVISLTSTILAIQLDKHYNLFGNYFEEEMSMRVMELDFQHTEDKKALDQIAKAKEGFSWYSGGIHGLSRPFFEIISSVFKILGVIVLMIINAPLLFIITGVLLVFSMIIRSKSNKIEIEAYKNASKINRVFAYFLYEIANFQYGKDIRLYGAKDMMLEKCNIQSELLVDEFRKEASQRLPFTLKGLLTDVA